MDDVLIERLWRSIKYEYASPHMLDIGNEARAGFENRISYCKAEQPHSALVMLMPEGTHTQ